MGFAAGLRAGAHVGGKWIDDYQQKQEEEATNELFTIGQKLGQEGQLLDAENNVLFQAKNDFMSASPNDMAGMLLKGLTAQGGKIDDNTARLAYGAAEMITGARDKASENEQKNQIFQKKMANYNSMIGRRGVLNQKSRGLFDKATGRSEAGYDEVDGVFLPKYRKGQTSDITNTLFCRKNPGSKMCNTTTTKTGAPSQLEKKYKFLQEKKGDEYANKWLDTQAGDGTITEEPVAEEAATKKKTWKDYQ